MTKDYKNLAVERVKLKNVESPKFCKTETINKYNEKKMTYTPVKMWLCVENSVREKKTFNK